METAKIEKLLDLYFEGKTTLEEEKILQNYFLHQEVDKDLHPYKAMFEYFAASKKETSAPKPALKTSKNYTRKIKPWYGIAAILVVALSIGFLINSKTKLPNESEILEAQIAFEKTREALTLFSHKINKTTEQVTVLDKFEESKNKIFKSEKP